MRAFRLGEISEAGKLSSAQRGLGTAMTVLGALLFAADAMVGARWVSD